MLNAECAGMLKVETLFSVQNAKHNDPISISCDHFLASERERDHFEVRHLLCRLCTIQRMHNSFMV